MLIYEDLSIQSPSETLPSVSVPLRTIVSQTKQHNKIGTLLAIIVMERYQLTGISHCCANSRVKRRVPWSRDKSRLSFLCLHVQPRKRKHSSFGCCFVVIIP